jgi:hypothetical protein
VQAEAIEMVKHAYADAVVETYRALGEEIQDWGDTVTGAARDTHINLLTAALGRAARNAQISMVNAYMEMVEGREGPASATHYRHGRNRLSGGVLRAALDSNRFWDVTGTTLTWGDLDTLSSAARHWHRLAAGAGRRGQGIDDEVPLTVAEQVLGDIGFKSDPAAGFSMPRGFWYAPEGSHVGWGENPAGSDIFQPKRFSTSGTNLRHRGRPKRTRQTRGIRGHDFFKPGLETLASELGNELEQFAQDLVDIWLSAARPSPEIIVTVNTRIW